MDKKYLSKIVQGSDTLYIKDAEAQSAISDLQSSVTGAMHYIGITTTSLTDGSTTNPIVIDSEDVTAKAGDVAVVAGSGSNGSADKEYVFNGTKWQEFGSTGSLKALAFKDSATGSVTAEGTNGSSTVTFASGSGSNFVTGFDTAPVAPSFTEGAFTPASLGTGFYSAGTAPSFTEGAFTPASLGTGFYTVGTAPSLGNASTGTFATEGVTATYTENTETLTLGTASTSSAVTAQGTFSAGSVTTLDLTKFNGGSKAADTFSAGTMTTIDTSKFSGGSKAADSFSAGTVPTLATSKALTASDTGTAAAQTFTGSAVSVTVS